MKKTNILVSKVEVPWTLAEDLWVEIAGMYEQCRTLVLHDMTYAIIQTLNVRIARPMRKKVKKNITANIPEAYYDVLRSMESKIKKKMRFDLLLNSHK